MLYKQGNLFDSDAPALGHGVNCKGAMGAGIAVGFRRAFPEMYHEYVEECRVGALRPGQVFTWVQGDRWIYNIASQNNPGRDARMDWLNAGLVQTFAHAAAHDVTRVALPMIGCGIGGLEWKDVRRSLEMIEYLSGVGIELWEYVPQSKP